MKRSIIIAALFLSACSGSEEASEAPKAEVQATKPTAAQIKAIEGRWKSTPNSLGSGRYMVLDIARTGNFVMESRAAEDGKEQIFDSSTGEILMLPGGMTGKLEAAPRKSSALLPYAEWTAELDGRSATVSGADGVKVKLEWTGL